MEVKSIAESSKHSAILSTFIKLPLVIKIFVLSIYEWPLKTGFTAYCFYLALTSTKVTKNLRVSVIVFSSPPHVINDDMTLSRRNAMVHWAPSVSLPNAAHKALLIYKKEQQYALCKTKDTAKS